MGAGAQVACTRLCISRQQSMPMSVQRVSFVPVLPQLKENRNTPGIPLDYHSGRLASATGVHTVSSHYQ